MSNQNWDATDTSRVNGHGIEATVELLRHLMQSLAPSRLDSSGKDNDTARVEVTATHDRKGVYYNVTVDYDNQDLAEMAMGTLIGINRTTIRSVLHILRHQNIFFHNRFIYITLNVKGRDRVTFSHTVTKQTRENHERTCQDRGYPEEVHLDWIYDNSCSKTTL